MSQGDKLIQEITTYLDGVMQTDRPEIRALATQYAEATTQVVGALRQCERFLNDGLPMEAVALVQSSKPTLDEIVAKLNFKRRAEWVAICKDYDWPLPPDIPVEVLRSLEKAYEDKESIRLLLEKWRALSRTGTTEEKLRLLRRIMAATPDNAAWRANRFELEAARRRELTGAAQAAIESSDFIALDGIYDELISPEFSTPADERVVAKIEKVLREYRAKQFSNQSSRISGGLAAALVRHDFNAVQSGLAAWAALTTNAEFSPERHLLAPVDDAQSWHDQESAERERQESIRQVMAAFAFALEKGPSGLRDVERLCMAMHELNAPIPGDLSKRIEALRLLVRAQEKSRRTKRNLTIAGICTASIGVLAVAGFISHKRNVIAENEARIAEALDSKNPELAASRVTEYKAAHPWFASGASLDNLCARINSLSNERAELNAKFAALVDKIQLELADSRLDSHEPAERLKDFLDPSPSKNRDAQIAQRESLKGRYESLRDAQQKVRDANFLRDVESLREAVRSQTGVAYASLSEINKSESAIRELYSRISGIETASGVTDALKTKELGQLRAEMLKMDESFVQGSKVFKTESALLAPPSMVAYEKLIKDLKVLAPERAFSLEGAASMCAAFRAVESLASNAELANRVRDNEPFDTRDFETRDAFPGVNIWQPDLVKCSMWAAPSMDVVTPIKAKFQRSFSRLATDYDRYEAIFLVGGHPNAYPALKHDSSLDKWYDNVTPIRVYSREEPAVVKSDGVTLLSVKPYRPNAVSDDSIRISATKEPASDGESYWSAIGVKSLCPRVPSTATLVLINGTSSFKVPKSLQYEVLSKALAKIGADSVTKVRQIADAIKDAMLSLQEKPFMHPHSKIRLATDFTIALEATSPFYNGSLAKWRTTLPKEYSRDEYDWRTAYPEQLQKEAAMYKFAQGISFDGIFANEKLQRELFATALDRKLKPVAIILIDPASKAKRVHVFDSSRNYQELWMLKSDNSKQEFIVVAQNGALTDLSPSYMADYFHGQILFSPTDSRSTRGLSSDFIKKFAKQKTSFDWPNSWPINMRDCN